MLCELEVWHRIHIYNKAGPCAQPCAPLFMLRRQHRKSSVDSAMAAQAFLGDIKDMYTNVPHDDLFAAIDWFISLARGTPLASGIYVPSSRLATPYAASKPRPAESRHAFLSLDVLAAMLKHDVRNAFFMCGTDLRRQTKGESWVLSTES